MPLSQVSTIYNMMGEPDINGEHFVDLLTPIANPQVQITLQQVPYQAPEDTSQVCDFIKILIPGCEGKTKGGTYPTLGIIGRLGAQQAQPERVGMVSDADGSIVALASAMKLLELTQDGPQLKGDVIISTHIATHVSITPHDPVDFMGMPVSSTTMNDYEVDEQMDAILSVDTSKGNSIIKTRGFAISATTKQGYILRVAPDLVSIMESATGQAAKTFPITTQDITPYDNGVYHFNSIMQPCVATCAPVVGVAITAQSVVAGCETGASYEVDLSEATLFALQVATQYTWKRAKFYDETEYNKLLEMYGSMEILQTNPTK